MNKTYFSVLHVMCSLTVYQIHAAIAALTPPRLLLVSSLLRFESCCKHLSCQLVKTVSHRTFQARASGLSINSLAVLEGAFGVNTDKCTRGAVNTKALLRAQLLTTGFAVTSKWPHNPLLHELHIEFLLRPTLLV